MKVVTLVACVYLPVGAAASSSGADGEQRPHGETVMLHTQSNSNPEAPHTQQPDYLSMLPEANRQGHTCGHTHTHTQTHTHHTSIYTNTHTHTETHTAVHTSDLEVSIVSYQLKNLLQPFMSSASTKHWAKGHT